MHLFASLGGFQADVFIFTEFGDQYVVLFILNFSIRICFYFNTFLVQKFNQRVDPYIQILRYFY